MEKHLKEIEEAAKNTDKLFSEFCATEVSPVYSRIKEPLEEMRKNYSKSNFAEFVTAFKKMMRVINKEINDDFVSPLCKGTFALYEDLFTPMEKAFFLYAKKEKMSEDEAHYYFEVRVLGDD